MRSILGLPALSLSQGGAPVLASRDRRCSWAPLSHSGIGALSQSGTGVPQAKDASRQIKAAAFWPPEFIAYEIVL